MSIFGAILSKIFPSAAAAVSSAAEAAAPAAANAAPGETPTIPLPAEISDQDVEKILTEMAAKAPGGGGNWKVSIVDLLKLLGLDSSLAARKELAEELNVHAGAHGSAEQNIALSKAVWQTLAKNGGKVPDSLKS